MESETKSTNLIFSKIGQTHQFHIFFPHKNNTSESQPANQVPTETGRSKVLVSMIQEVVECTISVFSSDFWYQGTQIDRQLSALPATFLVTRSVWHWWGWRPVSFHKAPVRNCLWNRWPPKRRLKNLVPSFWTFLRFASKASHQKQLWWESLLDLIWVSFCPTVGWTTQLKNICRSKMDGSSGWT